MTAAQTRTLQLYRRTGAELLERLEYFRLSPQCVLDLSADGRESARQLRRRYPHARVLAIEPLTPEPSQAPPARPLPRLWSPLARWRRAAVLPIAAAATALPLPAHGVDLIFSNLLLQRCGAPDPLLRELARTLKPGGLLLFATMDPLGDIQQLGDALMRAGFDDPVIDVEHDLMDAAEAASDRPAILFGATFGPELSADRDGREAAPGATPGEYAVPLSALRKPRR